MGQSRTEDILENILGAEHTLEPPQSRVEALLVELGKKIDEGPDMDEIEELIEEEVSEQMAALEALVGTPLVASTVSDMVDTNKIYVYVGSETGYTNGNWYYYNGSSWISGGVYNSTALETDTTLTVSGKAADAKATGDVVDGLKEDLNKVNDLQNIDLPTGHITNGKYIAWQTGEVKQASSWKCTDYIDVSSYKHIYYSRAVRASSSSSIGIAFYDSTKAYVSGQQTYVADPGDFGAYYIGTMLNVPTTAMYVRISINAGTSEAYYIQGITALTKTVTDLQNSVGSNRSAGMLNIAYSLVGIAPINTVEHYLSTAKLGFNCIKGDVRITSDSKLIMCHDAGFTLNSSGRITTYNSADSTPIRSMTEAQVLALEHSTYRDQLGYYAHPCTFEDYVKVCRSVGLPLFITLRDEYMDEIVPLVFSTLRKYRLENSCIINSFTKETLLACKAEHPSVKLSWVQSGNTDFTNSLIDETAEIGNCILSLQQTDFTGYETQLDYAVSKGVEIYTAILYSYADYQKSLMAGITGCQIGRMFMTYKPTLYSFKMTVSDGTITFGDYFNDSRFVADIVDHISDLSSIYIANIRENGTNRTFPDGIMPTWLNTMPYRLGVKEANGYDCSIRWAHQTNVNRLVITCQQLQSVDCNFEITVEV